MSSSGRDFGHNPFPDGVGGDGPVPGSVTVPETKRVKRYKSGKLIHRFMYCK